MCQFLEKNSRIQKSNSENKKVVVFILVVKMTELWKFMVLEQNHVLHGLAWWLWCMAVKEGTWAFRRSLNELHSHD